jgi:twitching motility protein PilT
MSFSAKNLSDLVKVASQHNASDIHIRCGEVPCFRIRGDLVAVQSKPFAAEDIYDILKIIYSQASKIKSFEDLLELDGGADIPDTCRLRFNFFRFNGKPGIILRIVKTRIPTIEELDLPKAVTNISNEQRGLVLITGATGSGKSTTLAAMINHINNTRPVHIITLEDPIEYVHPQIKARITQREIGSDTESFELALRAAMRQDPDIILIGELRDKETVAIALKAAETGHLVFATIHTTDAVSTIGRLISMFEPHEQHEIKNRLAVSLRATISQRMLKSLATKSIMVAMEIMVNGLGIKECLLGKEDFSKINSIISKGKGTGGNGSQTFDQHIMDLYRKKKISKDEAIAAATNESDFMQKLDVI